MASPAHPVATAMVGMVKHSTKKQKWTLLSTQEKTMLKDVGIVVPKSKETKL